MGPALSRAFLLCLVQRVFCDGFRALNSFERAHYAEQ
jgi:hypothetical protein